jgi:hypothetical protein
MPREAAKEKHVKVTVAMTRDVEVKYLRARCGVRYWEDATINGVRDEDGSRIPCRKGTAAGGDWCPTIELATGRIVDWPAGTTAEIHYKVCDDGDYALLDSNLNVVKSIDGYVPDMMCPDGDHDGDYVIMTIGGDGVIADWRVDLSDFERERRD